MKRGVLIDLSDEEAKKISSAPKPVPAVPAPVSVITILKYPKYKPN